MRNDELFVCTANFIDGYALGRSTDQGMTIDPLFVYADIDGIVSCDAGADAPTVCEMEMVDLERDLGLLGDAGVPDGGDGSVDGSTDGGADGGSDGSADSGTDPGGGGCGCRVAAASDDTGGPGWTALLGVLALVAWRRRDVDRQH